MQFKMFSALLLLFLAFAQAGQAQTNRNVGATGGNAIEVIDFHNTHRCKTCLAIEATAKEVVYNQFGAAVQSGKLLFKTVNVDEAANAALAERFEASGSALFVYNPKTGNAVDLTEFAFTYGMSDPAKLKEGIKNAIYKALN
jgi:hypothetical protein